MNIPQPERLDRRPHSDQPRDPSALNIRLTLILERVHRKLGVYLSSRFHASIAAGSQRIVESVVADAIRGGVVSMVNRWRMLKSFEA
jgi:hypothetical protein